MDLRNKKSVIKRYAEYISSKNVYISILYVLFISLLSSIVWLTMMSDKYKEIYTDKTITDEYETIPNFKMIDGVLSSEKGEFTFGRVNYYINTDYGIDMLVLMEGEKSKNCEMTFIGFDGYAKLADDKLTYIQKFDSIDALKNVTISKNDIEIIKRLIENKSEIYMLFIWMIVCCVCVIFAYIRILLYYFSVRIIFKQRSVVLNKKTILNISIYSDTLAMLSVPAIMLLSMQSAIYMTAIIPIIVLIFVIQLNMYKNIIEDSV